MNKKRTTKMKALFWLSSKIGRSPIILGQILKNILTGKRVYKERVKISKSGKKRKIHEPARYLKEIQRLINKKLLTEGRVSENAFGFSKGSVMEAIKPHLGSRIILTLDIKNAFPSVNRRMVFHLMNSHRKGLSFSWYVSEMLCRFTLHLGRLPQGAPTSPKIFDLFCARMDGRLTKLAKNVKGFYSRYADNIFFSMGNRRAKKNNLTAIPPKVKKAILRTIADRDKRRWIYADTRGLVAHKIREIDTRKRIPRLLGLSIVDGEIHNTRAFKRSLRKHIHHVRKMIEFNQNPEAGWLKLQGKMTFAQKDTMPQKLLEDFEKNKQEIKNRKE